MWLKTKQSINCTLIRPHWDSFQKSTLREASNTNELLYSQIIFADIDELS